MDERIWHDLCIYAAVVSSIALPLFPHPVFETFIRACSETFSRGFLGELAVADLFSCGRFTAQVRIVTRFTLISKYLSYTN
jgi:hypothetical protein